MCDIRAFGEIARIFVILPGFCVIQSVIELFVKRQNNALNVPLIAKRRQHYKILLLPGFLLKIRPDPARIFTKMSPDEELVTVTRLFLVSCKGLLVPCFRIDLE